MKTIATALLILVAASAPALSIEIGRVEVEGNVFVTETKGLHLKRAADTDYKRSVFAVCSKHAKRKDWADFVPAMRGKVMRFEVVDEEEWENRLNGLLE